MAHDIKARKVVLEWRYQPSLAFYGKMDALGERFSGKFPDWERSALTVEVRDMKNHRRCFLAANRSFFEADSPVDPVSQVQMGEEFLKAAANEIPLAEFGRIGLRYWFTVDLGLTFPVLVDRVRDRFYNTGALELVEGKVADVAYTTIFEHSTGWKLSVRVGPMEKVQWFREVMPYERRMYENKEGQDPITAVMDSFPDQFLYVDLDYYKQDVKAPDVSGLLVEFRRHSQETVGKLIAHCVEVKK